ncbi:MAG: hypothetical protein NTY22_06015, partial [Proteobacteria bacterium]|nr:hypothetical protein [Pseudomonadota bacterium]
MFILVLVMSLMMNSAPAAKNDAVTSPKAADTDSITAIEKEFNSIEAGTDQTEVIDIDTNPAKAIPAKTVTPEAKPAETKAANIKPTDIKPADVKSSDIKPTDTKAKPVDTKPADTKTTDKPVSTPASKKVTSLDREIMEVAEDHPEIKKYYIIDDKGSKLLVRKELDLNGDGKIDYVYYYDNKKPEDERVAKVAVSNNLDGRFDEIRYYNPDNNQLIRKELDLNFDGRPEI